MEGASRFSSSGGRIVDVDRILEDTNATIQASIQTLNDTRHERRELGASSVDRAAVEEKHRVLVRNKLFAASAHAAVASQAASLAVLDLAAQKGVDPSQNEGVTDDSLGEDASQGIEQDSLEESLDPTVIHEASGSVGNSTTVVHESPESHTSPEQASRFSLQPKTPLHRYLQTEEDGDAEIDSTMHDSQNVSLQQLRSSHANCDKDEVKDSTPHSYAAAPQQDSPATNANQYVASPRDTRHLERTNDGPRSPSIFQIPERIHAPSTHSLRRVLPADDFDPSEGFDVGQLPPVPNPFPSNHGRLCRGENRSHDDLNGDARIIFEARRIVELLEQRSRGSAASSEIDPSGRGTLSAAEKRIIRNAQSLIDRLAAKEQDLQAHAELETPALDVTLESSSRATPFQRGFSVSLRADSAPAVQHARGKDSNHVAQNIGREHTQYRVPAEGLRRLTASATSPTRYSQQDVGTTQSKGGQVQWTSEHAARVFLQRQSSAKDKDSSSVAAGQARSDDAPLTASQFQAMLGKVERHLKNYIDKAVQPHVHEQTTRTTVARKDSPVQSLTVDSPTNRSVVDRVVTNLERKLEARLWGSLEHATAMAAEPLASDGPRPSPGVPHPRVEQHQCSMASSHLVSTAETCPKHRKSCKKRCRRKRCRSAPRRLHASAGVRVSKKVESKGQRASRSGATRAQSVPWKPPGTSRRAVQGTIHLSDEGAQPREKSRLDKRVVCGCSRSRPELVTTWGDRHKSRKAQNHDVNRSKSKKATTKAKAKSTQVVREKTRGASYNSSLHTRLGYHSLTFGQPCSSIRKLTKVPHRNRSKAARQDIHKSSTSPIAAAPQTNDVLPPQATITPAIAMDVPSSVSQNAVKMKEVLNKYRRAAHQRENASARAQDNTGRSTTDHDSTLMQAVNECASKTDAATGASVDGGGMNQREADKENTDKLDENGDFGAEDTIYRQYAYAAEEDEDIEQSANPRPVLRGMQFERPPALNVGTRTSDWWRQPPSVSSLRSAGAAAANSNGTIEVPSTPSRFKFPAAASAKFPWSDESTLSAGDEEDNDTGEAIGGEAEPAVDGWSIDSSSDWVTPPLFEE